MQRSLQSRYTGVGNIDIGGYASKSDATLSIEANLIDGAVSVGNEGNQLRAGASVGVGGALRAHYGRNSDGFRSVGIGADVSFGLGAELDVKTDAPSRLLERVVNFAREPSDPSFWYH